MKTSYRLYQDRPKKINTYEGRYTQIQYIKQSATDKKNINHLDT
jgi:hypothetical protein